jgi:hypothetical protein
MSNVQIVLFVAPNNQQPTTFSSPQQPTTNNQQPTTFSSPQQPTTYNLQLFLLPNNQQLHKTFVKIYLKKVYLYY